mgnify:CR=1 FL=1
MKLNSYLKLASYAALFSMSQAAPALITRTHTAPAVTHWVTYTSNTVVKVVTAQDTVNNAPPAAPTPEAEPQGEQQDGQQDDQQNEATTSTQADDQAQNTAPATSPQATQETTPTTQTTQQTTPQTTQDNTPTTQDNTPTTQDNTPTTQQTTTSSTEAPSTPTTLSTSTSGTSTSSTSTSGSTASSGFEADILNAHNEKRALHGIQSLAWNDTLAKYAADYAASTFSCNNVKLVHSNGPYGENLAAGYSGGYKPVDAWYDEIKQYDFSNPGFNEATGHFTQLVWKSTSQVGCAKVTCDNSWSQYTICEYSNTRGNVVGTDSKTGKSYFSENVLKPID